MDERQSSTTAEIEAWAAFRYQIRVWNRLAERAARGVGLAPQHHQVLLAIKGFPGEEPPRIVDLAELMQLEHHSIVGLLDRVQHEGLIARTHRPDGRGVSIQMTTEGERNLLAVLTILRPSLALAAAHLIASLSQLLDKASGGDVVPSEIRTRAGALVDR